MLVPATRTTSRARALQTRRVLKSTTSHGAIVCTHCQQQRGFRFGPWGFGSDLHRDARKRHRMFRYRYMDSLKSQSEWNSHAESARDTMMKAVAHFVNPSAAPHSSRKCGHVKSWSNDHSGARPGRNIEDVEREAMDHLFRSDASSRVLFDMWSSPLSSVRKYLHTQRPGGSTPSQDLEATTSVDSESSIDPITNRRVPKKSVADGPEALKTGDSATKEASTAATSFTPKFEDVDEVDSIQPAKHSATSDNVSSRRKAKQNEDQYGAMRWNGPNGLRKPTPEEVLKEYDDLARYQANVDDLDAPSKLSSEEESKKYKDLGKYVASQFDDLNAPRKLSAEEVSKLYKDLSRYKEIKWNEPDGLPKQMPEELSKSYGDLDSYGAVKWNEPDGLLKPTSEELSKDYDDVPRYEAIRWNEPDGLRKLTPEELSKDYDDLSNYRAVKWNEPDGLRRLTPEEESKAYEDLNTYSGPFEANKSALDAQEAINMDPTPKAEPVPRKVDVEFKDPSKEYKDLGDYGPVRWNEPDGLRRPSPEELSKDYEDLHLYGEIKWNEPDGRPSMIPEQLSEKYEEVKGYRPQASPELPPRGHPKDVSKDYEDLGAYSQYNNADAAAPRVHPEEASKAYTDLSSFEVSALRPGRLRGVHPEELSKNYNNLAQYKPKQFDSMDQTYPVHPEVVSKKYNDLDNYGAVRWNEPDGLPLDGKDLDSLSAADIRSNVLRKTKDNGATPFTRRKLTGNYVRDFPEEFSRSWSTANSSTKAGLVPDDMVDEAITQGQEFELSSMDESFPSEITKLEPAINRGAKRRSSRATTEETPSWSAVAKHYGAESISVKSSEPATFKMLAYDSATDSVQVAETTSANNDSTKPLSPADVIPLLSNPAKFFPHFATLQAQGYEIVSGKGDVLVFRKVRPATEAASTVVTEADPPPRPAAINPVDMMGKSATSTYASPTAFVNYESIPEDSTKPGPPFRSGIDVRREEPVFSGEKQRKPEKRSVRRKLAIGAAWAVGAAYGLSMAGQYMAR